MVTNNENLPDQRQCNFRGFIYIVSDLHGNPAEDIICPRFKDEKHTSE